MSDVADDEGFDDEVAASSGDRVEGSARMSESGDEAVDQDVSVQDDVTIADDSESGSVGPEGTHKLGRAALLRSGSNLEGAQLGDYRIVRKVAKGGMGEVYEAVQLSLDRRVAVKIIADELVSDPTFLQRFEREAKSSAALNHPNVAQVYSFGREGERLFLAMEFVDGMDLAAYVKQHGKFTVAEGLAIVKQVISALQFALGESIIHRDIKPANLLYTPNGLVKITDLGLAKKLTEDSDVTMTGTGIGSPHYLAPEQADDARAVDHRADIYSLGITLMFLLAARRPFDGESAFSVVLAHANKPLPSGEELGTPLPDEVETLIRRMTAKNPADRHMDYDELLEDLERVEAGLPPVETSVYSDSDKDSEETAGSRGIAYVVATLVCALVVLIVIQSGGGDAASEEVSGSEQSPKVSVPAPPSPGPEVAVTYPPAGSEAANKMLEEKIEAIIRHYLPKVREVRKDPMPEGDLSSMTRQAEGFAKENPEEYRQILAYYDQALRKAAGTSEEAAVAAARKTWEDRYYAADGAAFTETLKKVEEALFSRRPDTVFQIWQDFPENFLSEAILVQAVQTIRNLPGPFVGDFVQGRMPQMPIPSELKIPSELIPADGIMGGGVRRQGQAGGGQGPGFKGGQGPMQQGGPGMSRGGRPQGGGMRPGIGGPSGKGRPRGTGGPKGGLRPE